MDRKKSLLSSPEVWTGGGLILVGAACLGLGVHGVLVQALAPFGIGLILSEALSEAAKAGRDRIKIRSRRDDD